MGSSTERKTGGKAPVAPGDETNDGEPDLDIDLATALVYPQKVIVYQVDYPTEGVNGNLQGYMNTWLDAIDGSHCNYSAYGIPGDSPDQFTFAIVRSTVSSHVLCRHRYNVPRSQSWRLRRTATMRCLQAYSGCKHILWRTISRSSESICPASM